jgi:hypothetical protein
MNTLAQNTTGHCPSSSTPSRRSHRRSSTEGKSHETKIGHLIDVSEEAGSAENIELPFDPDELDRDTISNILADIGDYEQEVQTGIYRQVKDFYLNEATNIRPEDIINVRQTQLYAERGQPPRWICELENIISSYFDGADFDKRVVVQSVSGGETVDPERAKELYTKETSRIEEAVEEVYDDIGEEDQRELISRQKDRFLLKLIYKMRR